MYGVLYELLYRLLYPLHAARHTVITTNSTVVVMYHRVCVNARQHIAHPQLGDFAAAVLCLQESMGISATLQEYSGDADSLGELADLYVELGDMERAAEVCVCVCVLLIMWNLCPHVVETVVEAPMDHSCTIGASRRFRTRRPCRCHQLGIAVAGQCSDCLYGQIVLLPLTTRHCRTAHVVGTPA